jgi:hypothetical protein
MPARSVLLTETEAALIGSVLADNKVTDEVCGYSCWLSKVCQVTTASCRVLQAHQAQSYLACAPQNIRSNLIIDTVIIVLLILTFSVLQRVSILYRFRLVRFHHLGTKCWRCALLLASAWGARLSHAAAGLDVLCEAASSNNATKRSSAGQPERDLQATTLATRRLGGHLWLVRIRLAHNGPGAASLLWT